jgi:hypothetical protein
LAHGWMRPARLLRWHSDPALFPELGAATVLASLRIEAFTMEFPVAEVVDVA